MEQSSLFKRIESAINDYISHKIEITPGVFYSQYELINRIYKFRNRDLSGTKINSDLSYNYYFDIISPRADSEIKNLRFDTKNIMVFSQNPIKDFAAVFISNAMLKSWMAENGEDIKLKTAVEEFVANGNIGFKKVAGGYEIMDPRNTYITNITAESIDDTDIIERHEMTASQMKRMKTWRQDKVDIVIKDFGNKFFKAGELTTPISSTNKKYEIYEFTGEVSEKEYNSIIEQKDGDENTYFLAKIIVAGLSSNGKNQKNVLFSEKLGNNEKVSDYYKFAHRGKFDGRFWRVGMYETLFDHQIRANEIGNDLARGLDWASKVFFKTADTRILQNIRADIENGEIIHNAESLNQVEVRMQGLDQLIADWNRLMNDADKLANSFEVVRGEALPSGTPFRMGLLMDQNAGKMFIFLRQKLTLPYKQVFREWVLPELIKDMKAIDVFRFTGETDILQQLQEILVDNWYAQNLVAIGPHTKEVGDAIKQEKLEEIKKVDPAIKNTGKIWEGVKNRLFVTITGENYSFSEQIQDLPQLLQLEQDPDRIAWILDQIYRVRNIPVPPRKKTEPTQMVMPETTGNQPQPQQPQSQQTPPIPVIGA
jgi:hypothetical protein